MNNLFSWLSSYLHNFNKYSAVYKEKAFHRKSDLPGTVLGIYKGVSTSIPLSPFL